MKRILMAGVAAVALGTLSAPALAQSTNTDRASACIQDIDKLRDELRKDKGFTTTYQGGGVVLRDYQVLRQAAVAFATNGMEARCADVVAGMRELARKQTEEYGKRDRTAESKERSSTEERRKAMLKAATPIQETSVSIENIMGKDVRNLSDDDLGDVEDVVMTDGKADTVIVGRGGFLGMGVTYYKVAWKDLKITSDNETVVLAVTPDVIEQMPKVEKKEGRWVPVADADNKDATMPKNDAGPTKDGSDEKAD